MARRTTIMQITDTHIMPFGQHWHSAETDTSGRLRKVAEYISSKNPDAVIMTGDAIDTRSQDAYDNLKSILVNVTVPMYFIPGNHDDRDEMRSAFLDKGYMPSEGPINYLVDDFDLRLVGLDTNIKNKNGGELTESSLDWLSDALQSNVTKPTIVFMHHFPFEVGQPIFDTILCNTTSRFHDIIKSAPNVVSLMAGHFHEHLSTMFADKPFFIGKSVAPSHEFSEDGRLIEGLKLDAPAVNVHTYDHETGHFFSHVHLVHDSVTDNYCFNG